MIALDYEPRQKIFVGVDACGCVGMMSCDPRQMCEAAEMSPAERVALYREFFDDYAYYIRRGRVLVLDEDEARGIVLDACEHEK